MAQNISPFLHIDIYIYLLDIYAESQQWEKYVATIMTINSAIFRGYHTDVFISAPTSKPSVDNYPRRSRGLLTFTSLSYDRTRLDRRKLYENNFAEGYD